MRFDSDLDMRMNKDQSIDAMEILNNYCEADDLQIIYSKIIGELNKFIEKLLK